MWYLIILLISFAGILLLLGGKMYYMRTGRPSPLERISVLGDPLIEGLGKKMKNLLSEWDETRVKNIFSATAHSLYRLVEKIGLFVSIQYGRFGQRLGSNRKRNGSRVVSFFLKGMAESKGEEEKKL